MGGAICCITVNILLFITIQELLRQREQLERTEKRLDDINNTLRFSQKHIQGIKVNTKVRYTDAYCRSSQGTMHHIKKVLIQLHKHVPRTKYTTVHLITYLSALLIIP